MAIEYFINKGYLSKEEIHLQLDERNEKTNKKFFLQQYLNTELKAKGVLNNNIDVTYFDSANNKFVQVADVFANLYYSNLMVGKYNDHIRKLKEKGILKFVFKFPL